MEENILKSIRVFPSMGDTEKLYNNYLLKKMNMHPRESQFFCISYKVSVLTFYPF